MTRSTQAEPLYLVIVPLIWIALAAGFGFFIENIPEVKRWAAVLCIAGTVLLPFIAATAYWALFSQNYILGYILFGITLAPMLFQTGRLFAASLKQ